MIKPFDNILLQNRIMIRSVLTLIDSFTKRIAPLPYEPKVRFVGTDLSLALVFGFLAVIISVWGLHWFGLKFYDAKYGFDIWFGADPPRVFLAMTEPGSAWHYRTSVHPLFSLLTSPLMSALTALGIPPLAAGHGMIATCGFLTVTFQFFTLRGLGLPRAVAALFTGVLLASATYLHWFSVIETYAWAAVTTSLMLLVLTSVSAQRQWIWLGASIGTLAVTTTNWSLAITSAFFRLEWRKQISMGVATLIIVAALAVIQKNIYPHAQLFFRPGSITSERKWTQVNDATMGLGRWTPFLNVWHVMITSAVTPEPEEQQNIVSNQYAPLTSHTVSGWVALGSWMFMLIAGVLGGLENRERRAAFAAVCAFLIGQCTLHAVYGSVTFLYAAHFFPALVMLAGFGWFSRLRVPAILAALVFAIFGGASNFHQFEAAARMANAIISLKP